MLLKLSPLQHICRKHHTHWMIVIRVPKQIKKARAKLKFCCMQTLAVSSKHFFLLSRPFSSNLNPPCGSWASRRRRCRRRRRRRAGITMNNRLTALIVAEQDPTKLVSSLQVLKFPFPFWSCPRMKETLRTFCAWLNTRKKYTFWRSLKTFCNPNFEADKLF